MLDNLRKKDEKLIFQGPPQGKSKTSLAFIDNGLVGVELNHLTEHHYAIIGHLYGQNDHRNNNLPYTIISNF